MSVRPRLLAVMAIIAATAIPATADATVPGNGRSWELVTPGPPVAGIFWWPERIDPGGDRLAYISLGAMPGAEAGDLLSPNLAARGAAGWSSASLSPAYSTDPDPGGIPYLPLAYSRDLGASIWQVSAPLAPGAPPAGTYALYRRDPFGDFDLLAPLEEFGPRYADISADGQRVVFTSSFHLLPGDAARSGESIYEAVGGQLRLVDVDDGGQELSSCGATIGSPHATSESGQRIFFTSSGPGCSGPARVYLREAGATTVEVSASHCTRVDCNAPQAAFFAGATPSGSAAFLVSAQQLLNSDTDEAADLYRFDVASGQLELLSGGGEETAAVRSQAVATSDNGEEIYFYATGRLVAGLGSVEGTNLYMAGESGLRFLATMPAGTQVVSAADGGSAVLGTDLALEAADTDGVVDVYRYDVSADRFARVSSGPDGGNGPFAAPLSVEEPLGLLAPKPMDLHPFSNAGDRVFFTTTERLVADDVNQAVDLYEWSAAVGVSLLSSGSAVENVRFVGATEDGRTAMFLTDASLLPADRDGGEHDVYAARVGGGFEQPDGPGGCETDCPRPAAGASAGRPALGSLASGARGRDRRLRLRRLVPTDGVTVARTGKARALVLVPSTGPVVAIGRANLGGEVRVVARGSAGAVRPGSVIVPLSFAGIVRRSLSRGQDVRMRLTLRQRGARITRLIRLRGEGARR